MLCVGLACPVPRVVLFCALCCALSCPVLCFELCCAVLCCELCCDCRQVVCCTRQKTAAIVSMCGHRTKKTSSFIGSVALVTSAWHICTIVAAALSCFVMWEHVTSQARSAARQCSCIPCLLSGIQGYINATTPQVALHLKNIHTVQALCLCHQHHLCSSFC